MDKEHIDDRIIAPIPHHRRKKGIFIIMEIPSNLNNILIF